MSQKTRIHWCDSTVNPTMGCDGCELWGKQRKTCYAGILHDQFGGHKPGYAPTFGQVTLFPGRMAKAAAWSDLRGKARPDKPWLDGLPRLIFVSDMTDSLCPSVSFEYLKEEVIENVISDKGQRHCWLWLTKRATRMAKLFSLARRARYLLARPSLGRHEHYRAEDNQSHRAPDEGRRLEDGPSPLGGAAGGATKPDALPATG